MHDAQNVSYTIKVVIVSELAAILDSGYTCDAFPTHMDNKQLTQKQITWTAHMDFGFQSRLSELRHDLEVLEGKLVSIPFFHVVRLVYIILCSVDPLVGCLLISCFLFRLLALFP